MARCKRSPRSLWHTGQRGKRWKTSTESEAIPLNSEDQLIGGDAAEDESRDLIEGVDEEGNNVLLEVVRYFFYNGEEYVVLGDAHDGDCDCDCEHCDHHEAEEEGEDDNAVNLYIMKVIQGEEDGEETEEFVPVEDEDLLEKLIEVVQADFDSDEELDDE
ncbi:MAG: DUF1292 domain-containing protein [Clostridia bacterium]